MTGSKAKAACNLCGATERGWNDVQLTSKKVQDFIGWDRLNTAMVPTLPAPLAVPFVT